MNDKIFKLEEMSEEILQTIKHLHDIVDEQKLLLSIIKKEKNDKLAKFEKSMQKTIDEYTSQISTLAQRQTLLSEVVSIAKTNESVNRAINLLFDSLNMFPDSDK